MELLFWSGHMVGCVEWANFKVGACVVLPTLHQVELNRVDRVKDNLRATENYFEAQIQGPECVPQ